jgi:hypothetical protein
MDKDRDWIDNLDNDEQIRKYMNSKPESVQMDKKSSDRIWESMTASMAQADSGNREVRVYFNNAPFKIIAAVAVLLIVIIPFLTMLVRGTGDVLTIAQSRSTGTVSVNGLSSDDGAFFTMNKGASVLTGGDGYFQGNCESFFTMTLYPDTDLSISGAGTRQGNTAEFIQQKGKVKWDVVTTEPFKSLTVGLMGYTVSVTGTSFITEIKTGGIAEVIVKTGTVLVTGPRINQLTVSDGEYWSSSSGKTVNLSEEKLEEKFRDHWNVSSRTITEKQPAWRRVTITSGSGIERSVSRLTTHGDTVCALFNDNTLSIFKGTGERASRTLNTSIPGISHDPIIGPGIVYTIHVDSILRSWSLDTIKPLASESLPAGPGFSSQVEYLDGCWYFVLADGVYRFIPGSTGGIERLALVNNPARFVLYNKRLFVGSYSESNLHSISLTAGEMNVIRLQAPCFHVPGIYKNGIVLVDTNGTLATISWDGNISYIDTDLQVTAGVFIQDTDGLLLADDGWLYTLYAQYGAPVRLRQVDARPEPDDYINRVPVSFGDILITGSDTGILSGHRFKDGKQVFSLDCESKITAFKSSESGSLVAGTDTGALFRIEQ